MNWPNSGRGVLDLGQPLEEGKIRLRRARQRLPFPCAITLVAASNPCSCRWYGDPDRACLGGGINGVLPRAVARLLRSGSRTRATPSEPGL